MEDFTEIQKPEEVTVDIAQLSKDFYTNNFQTKRIEDKYVRFNNKIGQKEWTANPTYGEDGDLAYVNGVLKICTVPSLTAPTWTNVILNGSESEWGIFGDASDGDATISGNTTLSSDKFYDNLTINGGDLTTTSYRIFVNGTLTITSGVIKNNGSTGGNGGNGTTGAGVGAAGAAGAAVAAGSLPASKAGVVGVVGGLGGINESGGGPANAGNPTTVGLSSSPSWGADGLQSVGSNKGGDGGNTGDGVFSGGSGSVAGVGGTVTAAKNQYRTPSLILNHLETIGTPTSILGSAGSGGGGGGGGGASRQNATGGAGGGGGGSGSSGGFVVIFARTVVNNVTAGIQSIGGTGGTGGNGGDATWSGSANRGGGGGGGQGGPGGTGGVVLLVTTSYSGTGTISVAGGIGGTGGSAGSGISNGLDGAAGQAGPTGETGVSVTLTI